MCCAGRVAASCHLTIHAAFAWLRDKAYYYLGETGGRSRAMAKTFGKFSLAYAGSECVIEKVRLEVAHSAHYEYGYHRPIIVPRAIFARRREHHRLTWKCARAHGRRAASTTCSMLSRGAASPA